jgi:hypothetical protein
MRRTLAPAFATFLVLAACGEPTPRPTEAARPLATTTEPGNTGATVSAAGEVGANGAGGSGAGVAAGDAFPLAAGRRFAVLLVSRQAKLLSVAVVGGGALSALSGFEHRAALGQQLARHHGLQLCARALGRDGSWLHAERCVPWQPAHLPPGHGLPGGDAAAADSVAIRLALPATGTTWELSAHDGAKARWP